MREPGTTDGCEDTSAGGSGAREVSTSRYDSSRWNGREQSANLAEDRRDVWLADDHDLATQACRPTDRGQGAKCVVDLGVRFVLARADVPHGPHDPFARRVRFR